MSASASLFLSSFLLAAIAHAAPESPHEIAARAVPAVIDGMGKPTHLNFGSWSYEGGNIVRGLWEISSLYPDLEIEPFLHQHLNNFLYTEGEIGYEILHDIPIGPLNETIGFVSIGDVVGLFPIAYADRLRYASNLGDFSAFDDVETIRKTVENYIFPWPYHLEDGTISRPVSWLEEGYIEIHGHAIWIDDSFMGSALTTEWALFTEDVSFVLESAKQVLSIMSYLHTALEGDADHYHHGYNNHTGDISCCKWGRGNGWAFMAQMEAMAAMEDLGATAMPEYAQLMTTFVAQAQNLKAAQSPSGGWHNILTNDDTFLETSCGGMYVTGLVKGVERGWLDQAEYDEAIWLGWEYIMSQVEADGTISNIIGGTGIKNAEEDYEPSSTEYRKAGPGVGGVLRAIAAIGRYISSSQQ